jgi:pimeloyl-ACP methyl ester carboxylesterase
MKQALSLLALAAGLQAVPAQAAPSLDLKPCRLNGHPTELLCGTLQRPLDPSQPQGKQIELRVAVVPALARNKLPDPVVFLAGGPGQAAVEILPMLAPRLSRLQQRRDLVFVDQRGTGKSAPLECKDERNLPVAEALDLEATYRRLETCRTELEKLPHGDLRQYTTVIAMQDLDAVREALGVAQWNLIGGSYGTRAGLEYLRAFPKQVRRAVLDGLAPPDMVLPESFSPDNQAALDALLASCAEQPGCQAAFPDLRGQWQRLMASLPQTVSLVQPLTGKVDQAVIQREHLLRAVRGPLYVPALSSALPAAIAAAANGNFTPLSGLMTGMSMNRNMRLAGGMHFAVVCSEDVPRMGSAAAQGKDFGGIDAALYARVCKSWPRATVPAAFYEMPKAQSPVLLLSGGADPVTPPMHGERVAKALGVKARHQVVPAAGHGVMGLPCMRDVVARFIDARTDADALALKTDCAVPMPRPLAFVPPNPDFKPAKDAQK